VRVRVRILRSAQPIIRLARLGRGRAEGAGEGFYSAQFSRAIQDSAPIPKLPSVLRASGAGRCARHPSADFLALRLEANYDSFWPSGGHLSAERAKPTLDARFT
jgi:hypothetical protein